jgi:hypothetical protein
MRNMSPEAQILAPSQKRRTLSSGEIPRLPRGTSLRIRARRRLSGRSHGRSAGIGIDQRLCFQLFKR